MCFGEEKERHKFKKKKFLSIIIIIIIIARALIYTYQERVVEVCCQKVEGFGGRGAGVKQVHSHR